ncbi:endonuclease V [Candidatus Woesearchaeota archaeon]|nr:endonuclease V [Candidatus Woesearchaeota archaeon]
MSFVNLKELKEVEKQILKGISVVDTPEEIKTVAGFDVSFHETKSICSVVVIDVNTLEVKEKRYILSDEVMGYRPGFEAFREGPAIIEASKSLEIQPDIVVIDGNGALHPNKLGIASYVGVLMNKPAIGVAKELLFGQLDEDKIMLNGEQRGTALRLRQFANPVFVTPGHKISLNKSVELIKKVAGENKLPLPLHLAHKITLEVKKDLKEKKIQT